MVTVRKAPGKHDMAVQYASRRIGYGFIHVIAFDEDREHAGDRAHFGGARALEKLGHHREHRRGEPFRGGRFADGQTYFTLSKCKPRD